MVTSSRRSLFRRTRLAARAAVAAALAATVAVAAGSTRAATARSDQARRVTVTRVTVRMVEYQFRLSVQHVRKGTVVFTVVNTGELGHIFEVPRLHKKTALLQPGRRARIRVTFPKPGRYYYICPVGAHVQFGMAGYLRVTA
jgi:plastocyanin